MQAKFTQGSILKHINVMTFSSTVGLLSLFLVDLADVYFLSLLEIIEIMAAVGYAGSVLFFTVSLGIGLSVGCGARVAQVVGKGDHDSTRRIIAHSFLAIFGVTAVAAAVIYLFAPQFLRWLGASGMSHQYAMDYIRIVLPSLPLLALAMACGGVMRGLGEAKSAMTLTLLGAVVNASLDPIFIFVLEGNIKGAAWATVCARIAMCSFGLWVVTAKHDLLGRWTPTKVAEDLKAFFNIALPAMLTNLSTPIAYAFITGIFARFGDEAVAGSAMVGRTQTVAFAGLFALSGAIGPIAGQNLGAGYFERIRETLHKSVLFVLVYSAVASLGLFVLADLLVQAFRAEGLAAEILRWFCYGFSLTFLFNGLTFVCNAMLNNLHAAHVATQFNFAKATVGTMPFVYFGAEWGGPMGVFWGTLVGSAIVAIAGVIYVQRHIQKLAKDTTGLCPQEAG